MEKFQRIEAIAVPVDNPNVDTDQIIPARFLRKARKDGMAAYLFHDLRFNDDGSEKPGFVLNRPAFRDARILVAERNFGCGSSREHAVYALHDYGIRAVLAPSFGDIFYNNSFKNGLLPIVLPDATAAALRAALNAKSGARMTVDLAAERVTGPAGETIAFAIDPFRKHCLLEGVDELGFTLGFEADIAAFEKRQAQELSWL
ncbi:MAG: 3-isopropylmalate dehydratase small subunit [Alphaproteobacteria bacterium]